MTLEIQPVGARPKGLFVSDVDPTFSGSGAGQRTVLLHEAFQSVSELYSLVFDDRFNPGRANIAGRAGRSHSSQRDYGWLPAPLRKVYRAVRHCTPDPSQRETLLACIRDIAPDFIVIRYCYQAMRLAPLNFGNIPVILDIDDRPSSKAEQWSRDQYSHLLIRQAMKWRAKSLRRGEEAVLRDCAAVLVANHAEVEEKNIYFPNISFAPPPKMPAWGNREALVLVGNFKYTPNRNGIEWFLERIWPRVREREPGAALVIGGAGSADYTSSDDVKGLGFVDSLEELYSSACAAIVPVRFGGGSNIKFVEALSFGVPVIATERCASAFDPAVASLPICSITDDEQLFADACIAWFRNRETEPKGRLETFTSLQRNHGREALSAIISQVVTGVTQAR